MAERHTVDVDVVGSKPIRLPTNQKPVFLEKTGFCIYACNISACE